VIIHFDIYLYIGLKPYSIFKVIIPIYVLFVAFATVLTI